jgi:hypothetical protein
VRVVNYTLLVGVEPGRWVAAAVAWRGLARVTGQRARELVPVSAALQAGWSGSAADAAGTRLAAVHRTMQMTRLGCWEADQALSEFAAGLARARALLDAAVTITRRHGLTITPDGRVHASGAAGGAGAAAVDHVVRAIAEALAVAAAADAGAATRIGEIATDLVVSTGSTSGGVLLAGLTMPGCGASPADVRRWWDGLSPAQRRVLVAAEPVAIGALDGVPAAYRDMANRLRLDDQRAEVDRAITATRDGADRRRLRGLRDGLDFLARRLEDDSGARAYLLRLDLTDEGRAVVALGDPDRADNVVTHVPGMTADLASLRGELVRAERVAAHAQQLAPGESTSGVLWLDYDAPDFVDEAASASRARSASDGLHRFLDGLRATHDGPPAHQTVIGHSYGSLVVGTAAAQQALAADSVVFVGSPGVGVDSAAELHAPTGQVWSSTSLSDVVQYTAVSPGSLVADAVRATVFGPVAAYGLPEDDLWFGRNPSDGQFGARVFGAQTDAGHLGYWDPGRPALDNLARIALGGGYQNGVTPR